MRPPPGRDDVPVVSPPQACKEEADAVLFLFSFTDRASFEELPARLARVVAPGEDLLRVVVGTKYPLGWRGGGHRALHRTHGIFGVLSILGHRP